MKYIKKTGSPLWLAALLFGAALFGLVSQSALAAGTASGTIISNLATLNYTVGTVAQTAIGSSVAGNTSGAGTATTFLVDNKVNLTVTETDSTFTPVSPGATSRVTTFSVTNNGNTSQGYNLVGANAVGNPTVFLVADSIDVTVTGVFVDGNANGTYESATDTATAISSLAPDVSIRVFVVATIPAAPTATSGAQAVVTLTATTTTVNTTTPVVETTTINTAGVDIVFADAANALSDPLAANTARDAIGIAQDAYRVLSSIISVQKTATVLCDPFNGVSFPKNIPGAIVQYTVIISNAVGATASATLDTIADTLGVASVTFDVGLRAPADAATCIAGAGTSGFRIVSNIVDRAVGGIAGVMTNAADGDGATFATPNVTINFTSALPVDTVPVRAAGELAPGDTATITYNVIVNTL